MVKKEVWDRMKSWQGPELVGVNRAPIILHETTEVKLKIGEQVLHAQVVVTDMLIPKAIVGLEFFKEE